MQERSADARSLIRTALLFTYLTVTTPLSAQWQEGPGFRFHPVHPKGSGVGFTKMLPESTGITFTNHLSRRMVAMNRVTENGSGVALGDVDGDGWCDIYFARLEGGNILYRNLGNWKFEDITANSGVALVEQLSTGAAFLDVDGDGDLDLLVAGVGVGTRCFLNNGRGIFSEPDHKLVRRFAATSFAFADIDQDNDLDLYVTTYRTLSYKDELPPLKMEARLVNGKIEVSPPGRFTVISPKGSAVEVSELGERDFFYLNQGGAVFGSISWTSGSFLDEKGTPLGAPQLDWGLSVLLRDFNGDGFPDVYVCNDFFFSPDRFFLGGPNGKFRMVSLEAVTKFSLASMAVDVADINRDGYDDFFVAEMLPRDHRHRQTRRDNLEKAKLNSLFEQQPNYRPEVPRNTLFLNRGNGTYAEIAEFSGVDASDWSWGAIFIDVDLDGYEDLLIPTGNNHDVQHADVLKEIARSRVQDSIPARMANLAKFGDLRTPLVAFRNKGDLTFGDMGPAWGFTHPNVINGMACADLDNDGDLDLVGNALNGAAVLYRNESTQPRLAVRLRGGQFNTQGIGASVLVKSGSLLQRQQILGGGRYLSNDDAIRVFAALEPSLTVTVQWPDQTENTYTNLAPNSIYEFRQEQTKPISSSSTPRSALFRDVTDLLNHTHADTSYDDFQRQPLLPHKLSALGPGVSWYDLNQDGWEDLIVGSGRGGSMAIFLNHQGQFTKTNHPVLSQWAAQDQGAILAWQPSLQQIDILVSQPNYETGLTRPPAVARARYAEQTPFQSAVPGTAESAGALAMADVNGDGHLDLFVGGRVLAGRYPEPVSSSLYLASGEAFQFDSKNAETFAKLGLVTAALFVDVDANGTPDLLLATEWGPLRLFLNREGIFSESTAEWGLANLHGLWNSVAAGDFNNDGKIDFLAGNWGLNCKYRRYLGEPIRLYYGDLDQNGIYDVLETFFNPVLKKECPWQDWDTLSSAIPSVGERVKSYSEFSNASLSDLIALTHARVVSANHFATTLFLNCGTHFEPHLLPAEAQFSPVFGIAVADFNGDGNEDAFLAQNFFGCRSDQGKLDAGTGLLLLGTGDGRLHSVSVPEAGIFSVGEQRGAATCDYNQDGRPDLVFAQNSGPTKLYANLSGKAGTRLRLVGSNTNPDAIGARLELLREGKLVKAREIHKGGGYWSQDSNVQIWHFQEGDQLRIRWPEGKHTVHRPSPKQKELVLTLP